jgi:hypothetical protein
MLCVTLLEFAQKRVQRIDCRCCTGHGVLLPLLCGRFVSARLHGRAVFKNCLVCIGGPAIAAGTEGLMQASCVPCTPLLPIYTQKDCAILQVQ